MYPRPICREGSSNLFFYYVDPASGKRRKKSCGTSKKGKANDFIIEFINSLTKCSIINFKAYSAQYLVYETNPRRKRYSAEGKKYGLRYCEDLARLIKKYVYPEKFADFSMGEITRGDIIDLRDILISKNAGKHNTVNKVIKAVSSIFSEAHYRGDIKNNPATHISDIKYNAKERGFFFSEEILHLFSDPDKWPSRIAYQLFRFAAFTVRRASEILALEWEQIEGKYCNIDRAWKKSEKCSGDVKWGMSVEIPLAASVLLNLPEKGSFRYIFHDNTRRTGETWWRNNFRRSMAAFEIDIDGRNISPHSFRHSLNTNLLLAGSPELYVKKYLG